MLHHELAFWGGVGVIAIVAVLLFKVVFIRWQVPGLSTAAAAI